MSLTTLAQTIESSRCGVISTDLFDTVLLRDHSIESARLAIACRRAARTLGVDPVVLTRLRWEFHTTAYRAVTMERANGEASLVSICRTVVAALGLGEESAQVLREAEVDVDIEHLRPNRPLLRLLDRAARAGTRIVAVSDSYYSAADLRRMIQALVGANPIAAVYSSADLGLTKHAGPIFAEVSRRESVSASRILHVGDMYAVDVEMARAAGWTAVHLPREKRHHVLKTAGKAMSVFVKLRRAR